MKNLINNIKLQFQLWREGIMPEETERVFMDSSAFLLTDEIATAYFRISPELRDFLLLCEKKHGVLGMSYDFTEGSLNFGVIINQKESISDEVSSSR